jgi:hypothetical protein
MFASEGATSSPFRGTSEDRDTHFRSAEIVIFGLRADIAQTIINDVRDRAAAGHQFVDGDISDDILEGGYKVCFGTCRLRPTAVIWERRSGSTQNPRVRFPAFRSFGRIAAADFPGRRDASRKSKATNRC